jgi:Intracellular proteinase inhibitor
MTQGRRVLYGIAAAALLAAGTAGAQRARSARGARPPQPAARTFEGVSQHGNLQEALNDAVAKALKSLPGADRMVRYRLREVTGEQGGIAGVNVVRVTIEVRPEGGGQPVNRPPSAGGGTAALRRALQLELQVRPAAVGPDGTATFALLVRNRSGKPVQLPFASAQQFDFEVWRDNRLVWRWGEGRSFTQNLTTLIIDAGQAVTLSGSWDLQTSAGRAAAPGAYTVRGYLPARLDGPRLEAAGQLTIADR